MHDTSPDGVTFAQVMTVRQRTISSEADLLALAQTRAADPSVFTTYPPFFWSAEVSSNRWDNHFTRMMPSTLQNFAADASAGVAFLRNHDVRQDPVGQSLQGHYVGPQGNGIARMESDFYALPTPETQGYIAKLQGGVVRDVSTGFYGGEWMCTLCGKDMQNWMTRDGCMHLIGMAYTPRDESGAKKGAPEIAKANVENANLAEVSGVYDGSTPGAMVMKARALAADGQLTTQQRDLVEVRYRLHLPGATRTWPGIDLGETSQEQQDAPATESEEQRDMPPAGESQTPPAIVSQGSAMIGEPTRHLEELTRSMRTLLGEALGEGAPESPVDGLRMLVSEVQRLRPLADDGRAYRTDLIAETMAEGVRAFGPSFAEETYKSVLETAPLATVKRMRDDWAALAALQFPGGRQSQETPPATEDKAAARKLPAAAHRA